MTYQQTNAKGIILTKTFTSKKVLLTVLLFIATISFISADTLPDKYKDFDIAYSELAFGKCITLRQALPSDHILHQIDENFKTDLTIESIDYDSEDHTAIYDILIKINDTKALNLQYTFYFDVSNENVFIYSCYSTDFQTGEEEYYVLSDEQSMGYILGNFIGTLYKCSDLEQRIKQSQ